MKHHFVRNGAHCLPSFNDIQHTNLSKLSSIIMCLPGSNTPRVFSQMNDAWTASNRFTISIIKSMLIVRTNVNLSCQEFMEKLAKDRAILRKKHSSEKYVDKFPYHLFSRGKRQPVKWTNHNMVQSILFCVNVYILHCSFYSMFMMLWNQLK